MSSPSNVHQRMLHFMRPDGMDTVSPAHVQQSLMKKYQGDYKYYWKILLASSSHKHISNFAIYDRFATSTCIVVRRLDSKVCRFSSFAMVFLVIYDININRVNMHIGVINTPS